MRILLISPSYHPVLGGLQTVTRQVARALASQGHDVRVVANRYPRSLPATEAVDGVPVERWLFFNSFGDLLRARRPELALASLYYNHSSAKRLNRLVENFRPDVVNLHFPEPRLAPILQVRRDIPFRLVVSVHGDDIERWFRESASDRGRRVVRRMLESADAVTACSGYLLQQAIELEPVVAGKATVIHNGVDHARFLAPAVYHHPRPYILAYGRHTHKKGFDLLLESFAPVSQRFPQVDLILAGAGEETGRLRKLRDRLRLEQRVLFYGRAEPEEVVRLLKGCRLVVIPSREEPFGIVAAEALLSGRPLVATRVGGLPEVATAAGADQVYWARPDARDLERAIRNALSAPQCAAPPPVAASKLSFTEMVRRYQQVLEGTVSVAKAAADKGASVNLAAAC
jgi:glycogen synthase